MSYILDALKKSERERPPGPVPDLYTVHGPQSPSPRRPVRAVVAGALLLAIPAIALLFWMGTDRRDEGALRPPAADSPHPRLEDSPAPASPRPAVVATAPLAARSPDAHAVASRRPVGERPQTPARPVQRSLGATASSVAPSVVVDTAPAPAAPVPASAPAAPVGLPKPLAPVTTAPAVTPVTSQTQTQSGVPPDPAPGIEMPAGGVLAAPPIAVPEPEPSSVTPAEAPPADGRVLELADLPASVRAGLPKLVVSGHVWSEERSLRLLSVDDRLLHEGGEAAPGVNLLEITPAGAVFVSKGWHFRVAGGRP